MGFAVIIFFKDYFRRRNSAMTRCVIEFIVVESNLTVFLYICIGD